MNRVVQHMLLIGMGAAVGCVPSDRLPGHTGSGLGLEIRASQVRSANGEVEFRLLARNTSKKAVYICTQPRPHATRGPHVYYVGGQTLMLCWAVVPVPHGIHELFPESGATVEKVEPGNEVTLTIALSETLSERTPYGSPFYEWLSECDDHRDTQVFSVDRVVALVGVWEAPVIDWCIAENAREFVGNARPPGYRPPLFPESSGRPTNGFVSVGAFVPFSKLPSATYQAVLGRKILSASENWEGASIGEAQILVSIGPVKINPRRIRCWDLWR